MNTKQPFDPKEILNSIELPDDLDRLIGDSVEKGYERMRRKTKMKKGSNGKILGGTETWQRK